MALSLSSSSSSSSSSSLYTHSATTLTASQFSTPKLLFPSRVSFSNFPTKFNNNNNYQNNHNLSSNEYNYSSASQKWRANVSFFPAFLNKGKDAKVLKEKLLEAIAPLDRGAEATPEDHQRVEQVPIRFTIYLGCCVWFHLRSENICK